MRTRSKIVYFGDHSNQNETLLLRLLGLGQLGKPLLEVRNFLSASLDDRHGVEGVGGTEVKMVRSLLSIHEK